MKRSVLIALLPSLFTAIALTSCRDEGHPTESAASPDEPQLGRQRGGQEFTDEFHLERCTFSATGRNPFFILQSGYTQVLESTAGKLTVTVLDAIRTLGGVTTRVVEEREIEDGELVEVSRNFFAICTQNNSVFYFGEDVDIIENGKIVSHEGSWRHGANGARAGLIMPGIVLLGSRYFQELAPGAALDRAEIIDIDATLRTPRRTFTDVLVTRETTPLEPAAVDFKYYAPGVGLIKDGDLLLVSAGFREGRDRDDR
jgi:hypothetical protein